MALRWTRIWCVRPVWIATWHERHAAISDARATMRVTACARCGVSAHDIFCRSFGSRPIGASMRRPACTTPQTSAMYSFSTSRSCELPRQRLVRAVVLGDDHQARRALVEPMHDAGSLLAADAAEIVDVMQQRIDERARRRGRRPGARPCRPACRRRSGPRPGRGSAAGGLRALAVDGDRLRNVEGDAIAGLDGLVGFRGAPGDQRPARPRSAAESATATGQGRRCQKSVEPFAGRDRSGTSRLIADRPADQDSAAHAARTPAPAPASSARQVDEHADRQRREEERDELRGREHAEHDAALVAAVELDDEARDRVEQHVEPERAAGERPALLLGRRAAAPGSAARRRALVELRRVQRHAERRADVGGRERIRERDRPRHVRRLAVAAAGEQAAEPAHRRGRARCPARTRRTSSRAAARCRRMYQNATATARISPP